MDSSSSEVAQDLSPLLKIYKDGRIERLLGCEIIPPSFDSTTNVESKDISISKHQNISARIFIPKPNNNINNPIPNQKKLPLLVYFHGGGFCIETSSSPQYHNFLNSIVSQAQIIAVSVDYRRAPEHPLPIAYEDSWTSLKWVASHLNGNGSDEWINRYADFEKVFLAGDSAGANIAHNMGIRFGTEGLHGINVEGIVLVHSFFWGVERIGSEIKQGEHLALVENLWRFVYPTSLGSDDPFLNPGFDPNLGKLSCKRVLVFVAENDLLKDRGWYYKELLEKIGWGGVVEVIETKGEGHVFHLFNPKCDNAISLFNQIASFINHSG
jgi:acetyl esterase/lipase